MLRSPATALKKNLQSIRGGDPRFPAQLALQLIVTVASLFPISVPGPQTIDRRQLPFRPGRVFLPKKAQKIAEWFGNIHGEKSIDLLLIHRQVPPTRR